MNFERNLKKVCRNELDILKLLNHPNIIKLHSVYEGQNHVYFVLDLLSGGELFERIMEKGHYSERDTAALFVQIIRALSYLHSIGIMHRDIKPENLIFREKDSYELVLADFGLAEFANKKDKIFKRCGTPGYVAPEILNDKPYDTKSDIFAAGVLLYIMFGLKLILGFLDVHHSSERIILKF